MLTQGSTRAGRIMVLNNGNRSPRTHTNVPYVSIDLNQLKVEVIPQPFPCRLILLSGFRLSSAALDILTRTICVDAIGVIEKVSPSTAMQPGG